MRFAVFFTFALGVADLQAVNADSSIPTALYNPANGAIFFDNLQAIFESGETYFRLSSVDGNINEMGLDLGGVVPLPIPALGPTEPIVYNEHLVIWDLQGIYGSPSDTPIFAGNIVAPGTPYQDLFFQSFANSISLGFGNVIPIPEPSTALLLLSALLMCSGNRFYERS